MDRPHDSHTISIHQKIQFYGPVLFIFAPATGLAVITFVVFAVTHWTTYVAITGTIIGWVLFALGAVVVIGLTWLASFVLLNIVERVACLLHSMSETRSLQAKHDLLHVDENKAIIRRPGGHIDVVPVAAQQYRYNVKVSEEQLGERETVPALPPHPSAVVMTGRQLLQRGEVGDALQAGHLILGISEQGQLAKLKIKRVFSMLVSGLPSTGKTTTIFWLVSQLTLIGARIWVVDPHMHFEDEDGNKSLAQELSALSETFVFPPCDDTPDEVIRRLKWMYAQLLRRKQPGYIVKAADMVIGVIDEFNTVAGGIDPKQTIVTHNGQPKNFAETVALLEREGRKYALHFMLIGHKWTQQDIGGDNAVRTNATTYLCHRLNDKAQADLLMGSEVGKKVLSLAVGHYWITGPSWNAEPAKIITPAISAHDLPLLQQIKQQQEIMPNMANVVEGTLVSPSEMTATMTARSRPDDGQMTATDPIFEKSGRDLNPPRQPLDATSDEHVFPEALRSKMMLVLEADAQSKNLNEMISEIWGCDPNTREGRAAKEELKQIRAHLAEHARKTMKLGA